MLFKKLSFLYLVFILFLFLTSPGEYVIPFQGVLDSQKALNAQLHQEFKARTPKTEDLSILHQAVENYLRVVKKVEDEFSAFAGSDDLATFKLKEKGFADDFISSDLADELEEANQNLSEVYARKASLDLFPKLVQLEGLNLERHPGIVYYFHETPNGIIPSVLEHFKTTAYQAYQDAEANLAPSLPKQEIEEVKHSAYIARFKEELIFGETFSLQVHHDTSKAQAFINDEELKLSQEKDGISKLTYLPTRPGQYALRIEIGGKPLLGSFRVESPSLEKLGLSNPLNQLELGESHKLPIPKEFKSLNLELNLQGAEVKYRNAYVEITPFKEGAIPVYLTSGKDTLDQTVFYAHAPKSLSIKVIGENGEKVLNPKLAFKLESNTPGWEIIEFEAKVIGSGGPQASFQASNKFLPKELRKLFQEDNSSGDLVIDRIKLMNPSGATRNGSPLILNQ